MHNVFFLLTHRKEQCFGAVKETARGIDINTLHGENTFSFLNMSEKSVDAENRIFEATWNPELGQPAKKG